VDETTPSYNLNVVVRETGIKPDTLRAWERRYGLPKPVRTEGGHRLYSDHDIEMIKWFIARQEEGMRISQVVKMWKEMTATGIDPLAPPPQNIEMQPIAADLPDDSALVRLREAWLDACLSYNEFGAEQILAQAFARYPVELVVVEVLQKGLAEIGKGWFEGNVTVQQEHFTSALALRRLNALISAAPAPTRPEKIIVGTSPGERHVVSPLLLVLFLRYHGWDVTYLGADVPLRDLEKTISLVSPDLVIYTATMITSAATLLQTAESLAKKNIPFAFGGRAFSENEGLEKYVPGYFLGNNLQGVVQKVSDILTGKETPNPVTNPDSNYQKLIPAYQKLLPTIHAQVLDNYNENSEIANFVGDANQHFGKYIQAGLMFGDLSMISPELVWVEALIVHNQLPDHILNEYIFYYRQAVEQELGEQGRLLANWLEKYEN